ncbi:DUF2267 domain-containing protein [Streptomyces sp. WMMC500]|uniref:DUF2267 domain-containing protein n=1 Tax=Streptomyces sp. WMMC500 TaxID=3015154 RepID=UPI00248C330B|nr:DUF2267 domain-containing protein [Streptomyces sp. WMMC500]WBB58120.1 DUF2267 domain-containing protein [Streptomyces sp. WMMC500]
MSSMPPSADESRSAGGTADGSPRLTPDGLLRDVQRRGRYADLRDAAQAVTTVVEVLGTRLLGDDRTELARVLPPACGPLLAGTAPADHARTPDGFIEAVADREHTGKAAAARDTDAVLGALADAVEPELLRRILDRLPDDHARFFGLGGS